MMNHATVRTAAAMALLMAAMVPPAQAQIGVPQVQVPLPQLPVQLPPLVPAAAGALQAPLQTLRQARQTRIRALLRDNPATLEADPEGAPLRRAGAAPDRSACRRPRRCIRGPAPRRGSVPHRLRSRR